MNADAASNRLGQEGGRLFAFGFGYCAAAIAARLATAGGWSIAASARSDDAAAKIQASGGDACRLTEDALENAAAAFADTTHLLVSIPPGPDGDPSLLAAEAALAAAPKLRWIGYLSTTGVYGDCAGAWVDENTPPQPTRERAQRRVRAEAAWTAFGARARASVEIFRLGGIYGPGRSPFDAIRRGEARRVHLPGRLFGRIHRDDVAAAVCAAIMAPRDGRIVNLVDDSPAEPQAVTAFACQLIGEPIPPLVAFDDAGLSPMARSFYEDNRRVRNTRMRAELTPTLIAPTYIEGLQAILRAETEAQADLRARMAARSASGARSRAQIPMQGERPE